MVNEPRRENNIGEKYPLKTQFQDLWKYAENQKEKLITYFLASLPLAFFAVAPTYLFGLIIDELTKASYGIVAYLLIAAAISQILNYTLTNVLIYKAKILGESIGHNARLQAYKHLMQLDYEFFETNQLGKWISRISNGSKAATDTVSLLFKSTVIQIFTATFSIIGIFTINIEIGMFAIAFALTYFILKVQAAKKQIELENKVSHVTEQHYGRTIDFLSKIQLVKILNLEEKLIKKIKIGHDEILENQKASRKYERKIVAISRLAIDSSVILILSYLCFIVINKTITVGSAVIVFGLYSKFALELRNIWLDYTDLLVQKTGMYRLSLVFQNKITLADPKTPETISEWEKLQFETVSFTYPSKVSKALDNVSFEVNRGEKVAVIGRSGSGKTTITKLLLRLYAPQSGSIKIGRANVANIPPNELLDKIKIVPQENELLDDTIFENIEIAAKEKVGENALKEALKQASALEFVENLPKKLQTIVGPDGMKLSGGEKQRICIARALISKPEILILDEATSNLDLKNEKEIHNAITNLSKDITVLAITHRITALENFDKIILLDEGKLIITGKEDELKKNPIYQSLIKRHI